MSKTAAATSSPEKTALSETAKFDAEFKGASLHGWTSEYARIAEARESSAQATDNARTIIVCYSIVK